MHARKLYMLHYRRHEGVLSVTYSIRLTFKSVIQKAVNKNRSVGSNAHCRRHIFFQIFTVVNDLHTAAAKHVRGTHHNGISYIIRYSERILHSNRHTRLGHRYFELFHHCAELISILCKIYDRGRRA